MRRLTINIDDHVTDATALDCVKKVVEQGRISANGSCYCYVTQIPYWNIVVYAERTRAGNDTFRVEEAMK